MSCEAGRTVLVLVPEIGLTPALAGAFRQRFGERVAIQHSGLSDGERHDQWQKIRRGDVRRRRRHAVGRVRAARRRSASWWWTRSTTDPTSRRRRRATTVGTWPSCAASAEDALVVLGSATPSLESYQNATSRPLRTADAGPPRLRPAAGGRDRGQHARRVRRARARTSSSASRSWRRSAARLARAEQVLRAAEPSRLRDGGLLPPVRGHRRVPATAACRSPCTARRAAPCARAATTATTRRSCRRRARRARRRTSCRRDSAPSASSRRCVAAFPARAIARLDRDTIRRRGAAVSLLAPVRPRRDRRARRHADDREGPRLPARHAGGRRVGGRRPRAGGLPRVGADVPAAHAGGGPGGARRGARRGDHPDALSRTTTASGTPAARTTARSSRTRLAFRRAMHYPPQVALTNGIVRARQHRERDDRRGRDRAGAPGVGAGRALPGAGPGARAVREAARRAPRPVLPQGQPPRRDARRDSTARSTPSRTSAAGSPSTSIRCRCCRLAEAASTSDCPNQIHRLDGRRREAEDEDDQRHERQREARRDRSGRPRRSSADGSGRTRTASRSSARSTPASSARRT